MRGSHTSGAAARRGVGRSSLTRRSRSARGKLRFSHDSRWEKDGERLRPFTGQRSLYWPVVRGRRALPVDVPPRLRVIVSRARCLLLGLGRSTVTLSFGPASPRVCFLHRKRSSSGLLAVSKKKQMSFKSSANQIFFKFN